MKCASISLFHLAFDLSESNRRAARIRVASTFARDSDGKSTGYSIATSCSWYVCAVTEPRISSVELVSDFWGDGSSARICFGGWQYGFARQCQVKSLLSPLAEFASSLGLAVLAVTHLNKSVSSAIYRASGSIAFVAAARAVWLFARDPDDPGQRLMLPGKMNLAPDQIGLSYRLLDEKAGGVTVLWGEPISRSADAVLQLEAAEDKSERFEAMEWLQERLSDGCPVSQREIRADAKASGIAWRTLRRAKDSLGVSSEKQGFKGGWHWQLPEAEDVQQPPKVSSSETWPSSPVVDPFDADSFANKQVIKAEKVPREKDDFVLDREGPGCTCRSCCGHFGTVAGWRAHIARGRCESGTLVSNTEEIR
jgi:hypothetical protein